MLFFRITSDLVPVASHQVCTFPWQEEFAGEFEKIGDYIRRYGFRISMHPDQFLLLNAPDKGVLQRSIADLEYQVQVLDLMGLDRSAKVQVHIGGVYGDKPAAIHRFVHQYDLLDEVIRDRLVIENDERSYTLTDCLAIHEQTGIPVIADTFHHFLFNNGEQDLSLLDPVRKTWKSHDGIPMVDYSSQEQSKTLTGIVRLSFPRGMSCACRRAARWRCTSMRARSWAIICIASRCTMRASAVPPRSSGRATMARS